jgi:hypothetical protein
LAAAKASLPRCELSISEGKDCLTVDEDVKIDDFAVARTEKEK